MNEKENLNSQIPSNNEIEYLAELFKIFGDVTRIKIIYAIYQKKLCVNEISNILSMTQSNVSHQLKKLKVSRLVKSEKIGKEVYYTLDDEHVEKIFNMSIEHVKEGLYGK